MCDGASRKEDWRWSCTTKCSSTDEVYPQAEYIRLVQDNLNTHTPASL